LDSWTGSGGSTSKPSKVAFEDHGSIECRKSLQNCSGVFVCSEFKSQEWETYERWEHDSEAYSRVFERRLEMNANEQSTATGKAAA